MKIHKINRLIAVFILMAACLSAGSIAAEKHFNYPQLRDVKIPPVTTMESPAGMKVFLMEDHELPVIKIDVLIHTGMAFDPADKVGLASMVMDQIRSGGIPGTDGDQLDQMLDRMGARISADASYTEGTISAYCLKEDLPKIMGILEQMMTSPTFAEDKLDLLKTQSRSSIARRNDDPATIANREFQKLVYGADSPYARQIEYDDLDRITRADLVAFHKKFFQPQNISLSVWGDFSADDVKALVNKDFAAWKNTGVPAPPYPKVTGNQAGSINLVVKNDVNQSQIRLGHLGIQMDNPDYFSVEIMNSILGTNSFLSRLMKAIRTDEGLTYGISGGVYSNMAYPGMTRISTFTKSESTVRMIKLIEKELKRIQDEPVTREELEIAKDSYLNSYVFQFASTHSVLVREMRLRFYGYPANFMETFRDHVRDVTRDDVQRAARTYLHPDKLSILVVGKPADFDQPLADLGPVHELDISIPEPATKEVVPAATPASLARGKLLIDRMTEALKATDAVADLKGFHMVQTAKIHVNPQMSLDAKIETWTYLPDKMLMQMSSDSFPMLAMTQAVTGESGWMKSAQGMRDIDEADREESIRNLSRNILVLMSNAEVQGFKAQYLGQEKVKDQTYDAVFIPSPDGKGFKVFLNPETGMIGAMSYSGKRGNEPGQFLVVYGKTAELGGILFPASSDTYFNDQLFISGTVQSLEINPAYDPAMFQKPEAK